MTFWQPVWNPELEYVSLTIACYAGTQVPLQRLIENSSRRSAFSGSLEVRTMTEPRRYRAYLLRLWLAEGEDGQPVWRVALEDARTNERHGSLISRGCARFSKSKRRIGSGQTPICQSMSREVTRPRT